MFGPRDPRWSCTYRAMRPRGWPALLWEGFGNIEAERDGGWTTAWWGKNATMALPGPVAPVRFRAQGRRPPRLARRPTTFAVRDGDVVELL